MELPSAGFDQYETPPVRDAETLQRRRRMRLLQNQAMTPAESRVDASGEQVAGNEADRQQLLRDCHGHTGVQLVLEVDGDTHPQLVTFDQPFAVIGSDGRCDIRIEHPSILPRHAYLQWIDGRLYCCSLGSSTNRAPVVSNWLGRPVRFGSLRISAPEFEPLAGEPADPQSRSADLAAEIPQVQLRFAEVEQRDNLWPVDRKLTLIGRGEQCKLRLDHPEISPVLACLIRTPGSCWLINLSDDDSLRVNDHPVSLTSLDVGDRLQFGAFEAEVSVAPVSLKLPRHTSDSTQSTVRQLASQHRKRLGVLSKSLSKVQVYLDSDHLDSIPELKTALQQYILHAQRHHREMQQALETLGGD